MEIKEGFGFKEIILENVDEFIELIRPDKKNINQYLESVNGKFIYRGQADSNWELEPSLFRHSPADQILSNTFDGLCFMYWVRLKEFINGCDLNSYVQQKPLQYACTISNVVSKPTPNA